ncbi:hypothetical protein BDF14DRAFT_1887310 [Spinellus fusiger]|nr:hypothetical protein BDF14DRAFT_1887310 [Spinellus fusiger]
MDPLLSLLFPAYRPAQLCLPPSTLSTIFCTIDLLPQDFSMCLPSLSTCLELPLSDMWQERQAGFIPGPGFSMSLAKDFFTYKTAQGYLRRQLIQEDLKRPNICASFFNAHSQHKILLKLFFA